ncbi:hypothetical protein VYU27_001485 [Nannochloropsis oceanica]
MLSQWLPDPGTEASSAESVLPFARSGGSRPGHGGLAGGGTGNGVRGRDGGPARGGGLDLDPSKVVEAHRHATQAEELRRDGRLLEALQEHLEASHCFLEAAELLRDAHGVTGAALVLLSDGHARQAHTLQQLLQKGKTAASETLPKTTPRLVPMPPPQPKGLAAEGSMYSSTMVCSTASLAGTNATAVTAGTAAVDDMLALERALQAIGSQPLFSSGAYQGGWAGGGLNAGPGGRYLSSTLGDSFFLVSNRHAAAREGASMNWEGGNSAVSSSRQALPPRGGAVTGAVCGIGAQGVSGLPPRAVGGGGETTERASRITESGGTNLSSSSRSPPSSVAEDLVSAPSSSSSTAGGGSGGRGGVGFLEGVEAMQQDEVMRLLGCMKTLGDENAMLIKQVEDGGRVRQENERLRREMGEFQEQYAKKFRDLRSALEEFRRKYPSENNPTNHVASARETARVKTLESEIESLIVRLNREREAGRKKDAMIAKYQAWYNKLRQSVVHKKGGVVGDGGLGNQQQQMQQQPQPRVGGARAGSSSRSSIRPPQAR